MGEGRIGFQEVGPAGLDEAVSIGGSTSELWGLKYNGERFSHPLGRFKPDKFAVVEGSYLSGLINCLDRDGVIRCVDLELDPSKLESLIGKGTLVISSESKAAPKKLIE